MANSFFEKYRYDVDPEGAGLKYFDKYTTTSNKETTGTESRRSTSPDNDEEAISKQRQRHPSRNKCPVSKIIACWSWNLWKGGHSHRMPTRLSSGLSYMRNFNTRREATPTYEICSASQYGPACCAISGNYCFVDKWNAEAGLAPSCLYFHVRS